MKKILLFLTILIILTSCDDHTIKTNNMTVKSISKCDDNTNGKKYKVELECEIWFHGNAYRTCFFYTDKEYRIGDTVMLE